MAQLLAHICIEMDLLRDAIDDIEHIMRRLVKCHGHQYRALERRIEALASGKNFGGEAKWHDLGNGIFSMEPFPELKAIIADARSMGVI